MAMSRGGKGHHGEDTDAQPDTCYLSDESDFYGDEAVKQDFEGRASVFSVAAWWKHRIPSLTEIANANITADVAKETAVLFNPYEGEFCGRQLNETVEEFLERLPPATTPVSRLIPWIYIANPYRRARKAPKVGKSLEGLNAEGPPADDSDWAQFVVLGGKLLDGLMNTKHDIEKEKAGAAKSVFTKAVNVQRDMIIKKLLDTAVDCHCTSGKWMIFAQPNEVNAIWSVIARATAKNELGIAAKVGPDDGHDRKPRLICVYTKDFTDIKDVSRVVHRLKDIGVVDRGKAIYYKCDAYTYLHLDSSNEYNIKASLYRSADMLDVKPGQLNDAKLDGFFYRKKKGDGDWRPLESE